MRRAVVLSAFLFLLGLAAPAARATTPADAFLDRLRGLCGQAFAGRVVASAPGDTAFTSVPLVMHVRHCGPDGVRIPFHVGENRSRTWVLTRTASGLRLKHDHRHADGTADAMTQYGGDTVTAGADGRQDFPADAESKAMFQAASMIAAMENVWAMEMEPGRLFAYELRRPNRHFRVEFDLTRPIPPPPAPWGAEVGG